MTKKISLLLICTVLFCAFFPYLPPIQVASAASITKTKPSGTEYEIAKLMACDEAFDDPAIGVSTTPTYETNVTRGNPSRTGNFLTIPQHNATRLTVERTFKAPHDVHFSTIIPKDQLYIVLDLYVDNLDFASSGQLEITSGGKSDVNEWNWSHSALGYSKGWNTIYIPLSSHSGSTGGDLIDGHINYCRWYTSTNSSEATYYFQSIRLVWFSPSSLTTTSGTLTTTKSGTTTVYDTTSNSATQGTYNYYSQEDYDFEATNPNHLLLADFTAANYSGTSITNVKAVGTNTGMDSSYPDTVTASFAGGGTISKTASTDAYNYIHNTTGGGEALNVSDSSLAEDSTKTYKWGYTIKVPLGKHVDLSAYTHLCFRFWMSSYHLTNVNGVNRVISNTPGHLTLNLTDSDRTDNPADGVNSTINIASFKADSDGAINHGYTFRIPLYTYAYAKTNNTYTVKKARTGTHTDFNNKGNGTKFVTSIGAIDTIVLRFYIETEHTEITAAPQLYLGKIWTECKTDTIQPASPVSNTYEPEQYSFIRYTPPTHDPIVNYNGTKHNQSVIMADNAANPRNIYIRGLSYGDHRFSVAYMSWPWRFDCSKSLNTYFSQSAQGGGGNTSAGWSRKNSQWLSHNSYQRFGGTSADAESLTAVSN